MTGRFDLRRLAPQIIAPLGALLIAVLISSLALVVSGKSPTEAFTQMYQYAIRPDSQVAILNKATTYYLAAVACAVGFRMGLFNIGVEGQYRLGALAGGVVGGAAVLNGVPGWLRILLVMVAAMLAGAAWAAIPGLLKATRGVSEVISTIMLNAIGAQIVAYLINRDRLGVQPPGSNGVSTPLLPEGSWLAGLSLVAGANSKVYTLIVLAVLVGIGYWFLLGRTRFGFDLRATGLNPSAAVASGVNAKRMVVATMVLSGAVAGLVALPQYFGETHAITTDIAGAGFIGIAIALLGRNSAIGMAFGALLWSFLEVSSNILEFAEIPREIVTIMQGTAVIAVVVAYELANRLSRRAQQRRVGASTGQATAVPAEALVAAPVGVGDGPLAGAGPVNETGTTEEKERA